MHTCYSNNRHRECGSLHGLYEGAKIHSNRLNVAGYTGVDVMANGSKVVVKTIPLPPIDQLHGHDYTPVCLIPTV